MVDFLVIGVQKGGTSWFYQNISRHPDVWLPFIKEVHYFDKRFLGAESLNGARRHKLTFESQHFVQVARRRVRKLRSGEIESSFGIEAEIAYLERLVDRSFFMTDAWYDFLFSPAPPHKKAGEVTPFYCAIGEAGIRHIKERYPAVKPIYIIRDPVERTLSCLRMLGQRMAVDMHDPAQVGKLARRCMNSLGFFLRGDFRSHIPLWDRYFGEQMLYIPFGDVKSDPATLFRRVESFLGIRRFDDYPFLHEPVHRSSRSGVIPAGIRARFADINRPQYDFLKRRFAPEFVARIR